MFLIPCMRNTSKWWFLLAKIAKMTAFMLDTVIQLDAIVNVFAIWCLFINMERH